MMKRKKTSTLTRLLAGLLAAVALSACGGETVTAHDPHEAATEQITQALQSRSDADGERTEFCQAPTEDPWGQCSQLCCFKVWIWGMDVCYYAPTPGLCAETPQAPTPTPTPTP